MKTRSIVATLATLLLGVSMMFSQAGGGNPHGQGSLAVPITTSSLPAGAGSVTGTFNITSFAVQNVGGTPTLMALGNIVATVTNAVGQVSNVVVSNVAAPVTAATASCPILSLTLGPIHLDLLGLVVDTNQINLNITAQSGAGNLLGNLLCSVSNLLNGNALGSLTGGVLNQLTGVLNQILSTLGL
jgi:hypothetical protein